MGKDIGIPLVVPEEVEFTDISEDKKRKKKYIRNSILISNWDNNNNDIYYIHYMYKKDISRIKF